MTIECATVSRDYVDSATGKTSVIGVTVAYPPRVNRAALLMELGAAFVDMVKELTPDESAEPEAAVAFADFSFSGSVGDDLLFWTLLGGLPKEQNQLEAKQGDDDTHG